MSSRSFPKRQQIDFDIDGKEYLLFEASAFAAKEYKIAMLNAGKVKDDKLVSLDSDVFVMRDYQLLANCCYAAPTADGAKRRPVNLDEILSWSDKTCTELLKLCKNMSGLDEVGGADAIKQQIAALQTQLDKIEKKETAVDLAKNGQTSGTVTSASLTN